MISDECPPDHTETEGSDPLPRPVNDNGSATGGSIDPRILVIARAIGRQIAQEQLANLQAANDTRPEDECSHRPHDVSDAAPGALSCWARNRTSTREGS